MNRDLNAHLCAVFAVGRHRTAGFCSAMPNVVETRSAKLCQDSSSILTHLDGPLIALASEPSFTKSSDLLDTDEAGPPL